MKIIFLIILYVQAFILTGIFIKLFRINNSLSIRMRGLICTGILTCIFYSLNCFPIPAHYAQLYYGLYYASVSILMVHLTAFIQVYTGIKALSRTLRICCFVIAGIDAAVLIGLSSLQVLSAVTWEPIGNSYMWVSYPSHWYFSVHLAVSYLFSLIIVSLFAVKISLTSRQQRSKFITVLWGFGVILILNAIYLVTNLTFDISLYGYGIVSVLIFFYAFSYVPRDLVNVALSTALSDMQGILICFDMDDNCVYLNELAKSYLSEMHNVKQDYQSFCRTYYEHWTSEHPAFFTSENEIVERTQTVLINGTEHRFTIKAKRSFDEKGLYIGCYFNIIDITQEYRESRERELQKRRDPLSGYYSREYFFDQVRDIILKNPETEYYLTCSNIVDFKIFNSIYGEEQGNQVLMKCAKAIENAETKMTLYGRISGDLFGFLLEKERFNERQFHLFISHLQDEFSNSFYKMRIQYGLYLITNRNEPISSMCEKVTLTMKSHKNEFNRIIFYYNDNDLGVSLNEKNLLGRFDFALDNNEITMFLQPQFSPAGEILGAEALVRWIEPDGTIISPDTFVPLLEKNGLISKVDLIIWNMAAQQLSSWAFMGREDLTLSVNISAKDFYYLDLYKELTSLVEEYQISPKNLCLEITETTIIQDLENVDTVLQQLRQYGFPIEIDDFGSGYSSLGMLKDITVDFLKIDMSFLRKSDRTNDERVWIIVEEILRLAEKLNMKTIVEGVESKEQVDRLAQLGCNEFQGFYFAQPETVEYFERRILG